MTDDDVELLFDLGVAEPDAEIAHVEGINARNKGEIHLLKNTLRLRLAGGPLALPPGQDRNHRSQLQQRKDKI
jgi:hypothetical protein